MAFLRKFRSIIPRYDSHTKLAQDIRPYFSPFVTKNDTNGQITRFIGRIDKGNENLTIRKTKIIYCLLKNAAKTKAEFDRLGLIKPVVDRYFDLFYRDQTFEIHPFKRAAAINNMKHTIQNLINRNIKKGVYDVIEKEFGNKRDPDKDDDPFNDAAYNIYIELDERRGLEPFTLNNPYVNGSRKRGTISYEDYIKNVDKPVPVCTVNERFRNATFRFTEREWGFAKHQSFDIDVSNKPTCCYNLTGDAGNNEFNYIEMILDKKSKKDGDIEKIENSTFEGLVKENIGLDNMYLLCYKFDNYNFRLKAARSIGTANLFMVLREKSDKVDCKIVVHSNTLDELSLFEQSKFDLIGYEFYKMIKISTSKKVTNKHWGFYYEPHEVYGEIRKNVRYWFWKDGKLDWILVDAQKVDRYIDIDKREIEYRLEDWLSKKHIDLNALESVNDYVLFDIGASGWNYLNLPKKYVELQAIEYGKLINSGVGIVDIRQNLFKHYNMFAYVWRGLFPDHIADRLERTAAGIRKIYGEQMAGIYCAEISNLIELGVIQKEEEINMPAGNYYFARKKSKKSKLRGHVEDHKFDRVISVSYGESSYLALGMGSRGWTTGITAIPTRCASVIDWTVGGLCMDAKFTHGISSHHLNWKKYNWRLSKLLRHIRVENVRDAIHHHYRCENGQSRRHCHCVGTSERPAEGFRHPDGLF